MRTVASNSAQAPGGRDRVKGGTVSDQADSLRQLVRAQRQWRELTLRDQRPVDSNPRSLDASQPARCNADDRLRIRGNGIGVFMARAAHWALARAWARGARG